MTRQSERLGRAGEYYVCSVLSTLSDTVTILPHGSTADVLFEWNNKIYKCQVKTVSKKHSVISKHTGRKYRTNYKFDLRRGSHSKERKYIDGEIDVFALYIQPEQKVIFIPASISKRSFRFDNEKILKINTDETFFDSVQQVLNRDI